ncbi:GET2 Golgi to ER traffic protein 2 [Candida maltosa Xu316]|uniref:Golgi to ER traffic protein 2 n=1 Tax=Candida maltosa (strain Xu316) TaxID=1245528 RepID=M3JBV8_CANMX|nr:Golgi to ER traffic protein 2 [Candida maltosa Xu316]
MSEPTDQPAELSAAEKKRLLRERRQAKMAKGQATDRLNNILSQGSSVKASGVKSVLDEEKPSIPEHDDDPDIQDIAEIAIPPAPTPPIGEEPPQDIDSIFHKMLNQHTQGKISDDPNDPLNQIMKMFNEGGAGANLPNDSTQAFSDDPVEAKYQQDLQAYNTYQQKAWKFRFLVIRAMLTLFNFFYHFVTLPSFQASNYTYVRDLSNDEDPVRNFFTWFATCEVVIVATYYSVFHSLGLFHAANQNSIVLKLMSMGSMVLPQLAAYQPLVARTFGYFELIGIIVGDLSLVIVLFGLLSIIN